MIYVTLIPFLRQIITLDIFQMTSGWAFQMIWSGYKAVDTFFTIGGLLVTKSLLTSDFCLLPSSSTRKVIMDNKVKMNESSDEPGKDLFASSVIHFEAEGIQNGSYQDSKTDEESNSSVITLESKTHTSIGVNGRSVSESEDENIVNCISEQKSGTKETVLLYRLRNQGFFKTISIFISKYFQFILHRIVR